VRFEAVPRAPIGLRSRSQPAHDFEAMLTTRYPLDRINGAIQNVRAFCEVKALVLAWAER
jgi:hypothetical protein